MRVKPHILVTCLAAAFCLLTGSVAYGQGPVLPDSTHYWTWSLVDPIFIPDQPEARDQFIPQYRFLFNLQLRRLLNPVSKYHGAIPPPPFRDSTLHYTWYDVQPPFPINRNVIIRDQFYPNGRLTRVDTLAFMLVPARKDTLQPPQQPLPPPGAANHYLCYRISIPSPGVSVGLEDQFRRDPNVFVYSAEYLCTPCWKRHHGIEYPPRYDDLHYILYLVIDPFPNRFPYLRDQFVNGRFLVNQTDREYLLVPATKEIPTPTQQSSWGRIKALYR